MQSTLGYVGLGVMGEPMCANLVAKSGALVWCFDLQAGPVERLAARGAKAAASLDQLAQETSLVFMCLPSAEATESVVAGLMDAWARCGRQSGLVVDMGTTSIFSTRRIEQVLLHAGHRFVDAPVARMPAAAVAGTLSIMVGGTKADVEDLRQFFECMGTDITHCGLVGSGQVVKILHNGVLIESVHAVAEAVASARAHGVEGEIMLKAIELGSADSRVARVQGRQAILPRDYPAGRFATRYALKDINLALELARAAGLEAAMARGTASMLQRTIDAGWADNYYAAIYEVLATPSGDGAAGT